jgi:hypothetical protein
MNSFVVPKIKKATSEQLTPAIEVSIDPRMLGVE